MVNNSKCLGLINPNIRNKNTSDGDFFLLDFLKKIYRAINSTPIYFRKLLKFLKNAILFLTIKISVFQKIQVFAINFKYQEKNYERYRQQRQGYVISVLKCNYFAKIFDKTYFEN